MPRPKRRKEDNPPSRREFSIAGEDRPWSGSNVYPICLAGYIIVLAITGFAVGMRTLPAWYQALAGTVGAATLILLLLTNQTDPGVIPPSAIQDPLIAMLEANTDSTEWKENYTRDSKGQWARTTRGGLERYCTTCNIWRPPRASHCSVCGYCMERFDHHCMIVGTCIALQNQRFFAAFLVCGQLGCLLLAGGASWRLHNMHITSSHAWENAETYFLFFFDIIYSYSVVMLVFGICHCFAILCDVTTKDMMTSHTLRTDPPCCGRRNPASLVRAWWWVCCAPVQWKYRADQKLASTKMMDGDV